MIPNIFYITEKAWNYFPYTVTEYTVSNRLKYQLNGLGAAGRNLGFYVIIRTASND